MKLRKYKTFHSSKTEVTAPVTKRTAPTGNILTKQHGQISIFFASSLVVLITLIAFIVNIGIFVKAKINLQNATDAAAFSGASTQARHLTRIAYLNWEMRNVYKEWIYKYYVLGGLNLKANSSPTDPVDYGLLPDPLNGDKDPYNFPSVCMHFQGVSNNLCEKYGVPGIPRFEPTNMVAIDETTTNFIDAISKQKANDCSVRTRLNYAVTNMWAYNVLTSDPSLDQATSEAPQIAATRMGAWPQALELALRIRNLENAVNRPAIADGLCMQTGPRGTNCGMLMANLAQEKNLGNERPVKAYYSAFRNLGNESDNEMKNSFRLTELPPKKPQLGGIYSLSHLLMPSAATQQGKPYLDLKLMIVNYATFFNSMIALKGQMNINGVSVNDDSRCEISKVAIPVPGYPLGFFKNPNVVTYYAVKGEANFVGLFNPFSDPTIKLTAYAAAKPFGGRIGPMLFKEASEDNGQVVGRQTASRYRSTPYISGINMNGGNLPQRSNSRFNVATDGYTEGAPIPINTGNDSQKRFWIQSTADVVGGQNSGNEIFFGIPNLAYDFEPGGYSQDPYADGSSSISIITPSISGGTPPKAGLYRQGQIQRLKQPANLGDPQSIDTAIYEARAPTRYEAANYLIPTPSNWHISKKVAGAPVDSLGMVQAEVIDGVYNQVIYAPLYSKEDSSALYKDASEIIPVINQYLRNQYPAMEKYRGSMNQVAAAIYRNDPTIYGTAAKQISSIDLGGGIDANNLNAVYTARPTCASVAGQFLYFYGGTDLADTATGIVCPSTLENTLRSYYNKVNAGDFSSEFVRIQYKFGSGNNLENQWQDLLSAYVPGVARGVGQDGQFTTPFPPSEPESMKRSAYSAKLISLRSVSGTGGYADLGFPNHNEGVTGAQDADTNQSSFKNSLNVTAPAEIRY